MSNTISKMMPEAINAAAVIMDAAAIATTAAAILKKYGTIAGIKATAAALREKYGAQNWRAILGRCKEFRAADIDAAADAAKADVFNYGAILRAAFGVLARDANYKKLCGYARATYKGTDADTAAALVSDYYTAVDVETGAPLQLITYADTKKALIFTAYQPRPLVDVDGVKVLRACLDNMKKATKKAAGKAADATAAKIDNKHAVGVIVAVWDADTDATTGAIIKGAPLTGKHATTDKIKAAAVKAAAGLCGRAVPAAAVKVSELNAEILKAHRAETEKALQEKRAAVKADAAAAGVRTAPRPKKAAGKAEKAAPVSVVDMEKAAKAAADVDAFINANNAAAKAAAAVVH